MRSAAMEVKGETGLCGRSEPEMDPWGPHIEFQSCPGISPIRTRPLLFYSNQFLGDQSPGKGQGFGEGGCLQQVQFQKRSGSQVRKSCDPHRMSSDQNHSLTQAAHTLLSWRQTFTVEMDSPMQEGCSDGKYQPSMVNVMSWSWGTWPSHQWVKWSLCLVRWSSWVSSQ